MKNKWEDAKNELYVLEKGMCNINLVQEAREAYDKAEKLIMEIKSGIQGKIFACGEIVNKTGNIYDASNMPSDVVQCEIQPGELYSFSLQDYTQSELIERAKLYTAKGFVPEKRTGRFGEIYIVLRYEVVA